MKVTSQIFSATSLISHILPGERTTQLILRRPMHSRPQLVTVTMRSCKG
jgi:hypothetical protein